MIGRVEEEITVVDDQMDYRLPLGFRHFVSLIRYTSKTDTKATIATADYTDAPNKTITKASGFADYVFKTGDILTITAPTANAGSYTIASQTDSNNILLSTSAGADASGTISATIGRSVPDKDYQLEEYNTIPELAPGPGVVIHSQLGGMQIKPPPSIASNQTFVLTYLKAPILLHWGRAQSVGANTMHFEAAATVTAPGDGEIIQTDGYYNGSLVNIYSATTGAQQANKIKHSKVIAANEVKVEFVNSWPETPTGNIDYEIVPLFPLGMDSIYAIDVAMANSPRRHNRMWRENLRSREKLWKACINYALSGTMDRAPSRNLPIDWAEDDPYDY
jgi:hypothetical protein